ncbi:MAG: hypothetical protein K0R14_2049 [Burkholderiales bacterium]|jgi:hypothetical protein|nr:hypothetical protein [Burkholderiales bacterium]
MSFKQKLLIVTVIFCALWMNQSGATGINANEVSQTTKEQTESYVLQQYSGVQGTAPKHDTVSSSGAAFELLPNGTNVYGFFSQTLANDIYYEARLYGRYNYVTANPNIPGIPASDENPPLGYGIVGILGYNFHPNSSVDITPYVRLNAYNNMGPVYADTDGDYIHSTTYALLLGGKLVFKATSVFSPFINIWSGFQTNDLVGSYPNATTHNNNTLISGTLNQWATTYEIGMGTRLSEHITLTPYWQYTTTFNYPNNSASLAINQGGLSQSDLTGTAQAFGLKLGVAW